MSYRNETVFVNNMFANGDVFDISADLRIQFPVKQIDVSFIVTASQPLALDPAGAIRTVNSNVILRSNMVPGKDLGATIIGHWSPVTTFNFTQGLMLNGWTGFWVDTLAVVGGNIEEVRLNPDIGSDPYTMCIKIVFHSV